MTGFGRAEIPLRPSGRAVIEIRTLNHRFLEIETRLPEGFQAFEDTVRTAVTRAVRRGQVRVSVVVRTGEMPSGVSFQAGAAKRYAAQLQRLKRQAGLSGEVTLGMVLGLPEVMVVAGKESLAVRHWKQIERAVIKALKEAVQMRRKEGGRLQKAIAQVLQTLQELVLKVRRRTPEFQKELERRLAERIETLLQAAPGTETVQDSQVLAEAASLVQATDVTEEVSRIGSHLKALEAVISGKKPEKLTATHETTASSPGRTMDFLAQELQREVNTLGTKLRDPAVVGWVVAMKGQIEKLREQSANLE